MKVGITYKITNWEADYETARTREIKRLAWVPVSNSLDSDSYADLIGHPDGPAHFAAWIVIMMIASRATPRGSVVRENGLAHDAKSLARVSRMPESVFEAAIPRLLEIGLLEVGGNKSRRIKSVIPRRPERSPQEPEIPPQEAATPSHEVATELNGIEQKGIERTESSSKEQKEKNGTALAKLEPDPVDRKAKSFLSKADDDEKPATEYASATDEFKAFFRRKAAKEISQEVLSAVQSNLELTAVPMEAFVAELRANHVNGRWENPSGLVRNLSRTFRKITRAAGPAVTAAEAAIRNYRCTNCGSNVPGEGLRLVSGKCFPCTCAAPEYVAMQRSRGIIEEQTAGVA